MGNSGNPSNHTATHLKLRILCPALCFPICGTLGSNVNVTYVLLKSPGGPAHNRTGLIQTGRSSPLNNLQIEALLHT